jgi:hypothetical protein
MLTFEDCLHYCDLSEVAVEVVAEHEHLPEMVACELASYLMGSHEGKKLFMRFLEDDLQAAILNQDTRKLTHLNNLKLEFGHCLQVG